MRIVYEKLPFKEQTKICVIYAIVSPSFTIWGILKKEMESSLGGNSSTFDR